MVRQRTLTPSFQGSNPCSPVKSKRNRESGSFLCCTIHRKEGIISVIKSEKDKERGRFEKYEHYNIVKIRHRKTY